jgi:hypothetical protein
VSDPDKTVSGDSDTWMLFERTTSDGFPLVVLARTGNSLVDEVLRSGCVTIVECQPDPSIINDRRMPQHTDRIYPVEDGLVELLAGTGALHIASVTGDGLRRVFYAHTDTIDFPVMVQRFVVQDYILRAERAENLADWAPVISPTEIDRQLNGDRGVIAQLEDAGDTLTTPRKVDFWAYGDRSSLTNFARELGSWDFEIDHWTDGEDGLVLTRELAPNLDTFREVTPVLVETADRHGVAYDGWETFVVNPSKPIVETSPSLLSKLFGGKKK